ncbi:MAG: hypothetical protein EOO24_42835 [Comamonadaceae bacterium]|nr:MAG: hypothetical protein EOO24_42835 [Comamonadaceae bacterium]
MRSALAAIALLAAAAVQAQAPVTREPTGEPRKNQRIERIVTEDGGNRIDELRVGGETQAITVQPKAPVPAYEIQPTDLARSRPADRRDGLSGGGGQRVWNVFGF